MPYNFDEIIDRSQSHAVKYEFRKALFGREDVVPMWVADMDFRTPDFILDAIRERLDHPVLGYTMRPDAYFEAQIAWLHRRQNWEVKRPWMLYSPGVVPALNMAVHAFTQPGDKIIVQPPVYHPFYMAIEDHGRHVVRNPLKLVNGRYEMDFDDLLRKIDHRTKMLLLSHPHNPGGTVWSRETLEQLGNFCVEHDIILISDEIHADLLVAPHATHTPMASISESIANQTITCVAASKTFNLAGLSTATIIISNPKIRRQFETVLQAWHVHVGNIPGMVATWAACEKGDEWLDELRPYLLGNYHEAKRILTQLPGVELMEMEATYLLWIDFRALGLEHKQLEERIFRQAGIGLNTGTMFGSEGTGFMRMNLAHPRSVVTDACQRIVAALR